MASPFETELGMAFHIAWHGLSYSMKLLYNLSDVGNCKCKLLVLKYYLTDLSWPYHISSSRKIFVGSRLFVKT